MKKTLEFLKIFGRLKFIYRYSEVSRIPQESVAAHSWRLALMVFLIADELNLDIDVEKALKIALVHDIAESLTGDIDIIKIKDKKISKKEKDELEFKTMNRLKSIDLKFNKISDLWQEYQENKTREAKIVKALDKLEAMVFLSEIGYKFYDRPEFIPVHADEYVKDFTELKPLLKEIKLNLKKEFEKGNISWKDEYNYGL